MIWREGYMYQVEITHKEKGKKVKTLIQVMPVVSEAVFYLKIENYCKTSNFADYSYKIFDTI